MLTINKNVILTILAALVTTTVVKFIFAGTSLVLNPVGIIVTLLFLFLLMQVYLKGYEGKGHKHNMAEGIRFGLLFGLVVITYKLTNIDVIAIDNTVIHTLVEYLVAGVTFSLVYKK